MNLAAEPIYHLVSEIDLRGRIEDDVYAPVNLAGDGFVHCARERSVIAVANDYFAGAARVLLLKIDPKRLTADTRYEAPAPMVGGGTSHLAGGSQFPHVYGPIDLLAIIGIGVLSNNEGGFGWPSQFMPLDSFLNQPSEKTHV